MVTPPNLTGVSPAPLPLPRSKLADDEMVFGKIMLMGSSGDAASDCQHPALRHFVNLAGGRRARIVVLSQTPDDTAHEIANLLSILRFQGAKRVDLVEVAARCTGLPNPGQTVAQASGFLFIGADPRTMLAGLAGSVLLSTIRSRHRNGAAIAGIGAGAAILGQEALCPPVERTAGERAFPVTRKGNHAAFPGLKFLPGWIVDPSYGRNRSVDRLLMSLAADPSRLGLGIESGVAVLANATGQVTSLGGGLAVVVDSREAGSDYAERRLGEIVSIAGPRLYVLGEGKRFDPRPNAPHALLP